MHWRYRYGGTYRTQIRRSDPHRIARPHDHSAAIHLERHQPQVQLDDRRTRGRDRAFVHLPPDRNRDQKDVFTAKDTTDSQ